MQRLIYAWLFLSGATIVSWWLGAHSQRFGVIAVMSILLVAMIKCRVVMRTYMDVRFAPRWLRLTCDAWLVLNLGMISMFYLTAA